jgi:hypothetical protein
MKKTVSHSIIILTAFLFLNQSAFAQNNRDSERNQIGWYAFFMNYKLDDKWSIHGEFQWRRTDWIAGPQQNLYRTGINYRLHPQVVARAGYAFADTFNYGTEPIAGNGIRFPEHRVFQMITIANPVGKFGLSHRFMLEQRWLGRSLDPKATQHDEYIYLNRIRYMFRMDFPLRGNTLDNNEPYLAFYDEIFIGFGKNVNQNVFDQNRIGLLAGYRFSGTTRIEGGYLNQTVQFGRLVNGNNYFQVNQGLILMTYLNF